MALKHAVAARRGLPSSAYTSRTAFIPYGATHSSICFKHSLKSTPSYTGLTVIVVGNATGPEHSTTNGMRGAVAGGTTATGYYITGWPAGLTTAGQMCFEISRAWLCTDSSQFLGTTGDAVTAAQCVPVSWQHHDNAGVGAISLFRVSGNGGQVGFKGLFGAQSVGLQYFGWLIRSATAGRFHSQGKDEFVKVRIGWYTESGARRVVLDVDGMVTAYFDRADTQNPFTSLAIGGRINTFNGPTPNPAGSMLDTWTGASHWIRNMQVSTLSPVVPTALTTGPRDTVAIMSDSIIAAAAIENSGYGDLAVDARIHKAYSRKLVKFSALADLYRMQAGGHTMAATAITGQPSFYLGEGSTGTQTVSAGSTSTNVRGVVSALGYKTILINGGSNDVNTNCTADDFRDAVRDHIEYFLGLNGQTPAGAVPERILITNIVDRGSNWDDAAPATYSSGATTFTVLNAFADYYSIGDSIAGTHIQAATTITNKEVGAAGGGTLTRFTISATTTNSGTNVNIYNSTTYATSILRTKAATFRDELAGTNGAQGIAQWFAETYPAVACEIRIVDTFNAMGGIAQYTGKISTDTVHPSYAGALLLHDCVAEALAA